MFKALPKTNLHRMMPALYQIGSFFYLAEASRAFTNKQSPGGGIPGLLIVFLRICHGKRMTLRDALRYLLELILFKVLSLRTSQISSLLR